MDQSRFDYGRTQGRILARNPFGQVPVLVDGCHLPDAQAILVYLARQYGGEEWLPLDAPT